MSTQVARSYQNLYLIIFSNTQLKTTVYLYLNHPSFHSATISVTCGLLASYLDDLPRGLSAGIFRAIRSMARFP